MRDKVLSCIQIRVSDPGGSAVQLNDEIKMGRWVWVDKKGGLADKSWYGDIDDAVVDIIREYIDSRVRILGSYYIRIDFVKLRRLANG